MRGDVRGFLPMPFISLSHTMLSRDTRRLLELRAHNKLWVQRRRRWEIAGDELLLRCMRALCNIPEPC
jgi:hypothetical protein